MQTRFDSAEQARKEQNEKEVAHFKQAYAIAKTGLDNKVVVVSNVTDSGDVYVPKANGTFLFAKSGNNVYKVTLDQLTDVTKGEMVISLATGDHAVLSIKENHEAQQPFETYHALKTIKLGKVTDGDNVAVLLLDAIKHYLELNFNITGYDTRIKSVADLFEGINAVPTQSNPSEDHTGEEHQETPTQGGSSEEHPAGPEVQK